MIEVKNLSKSFSENIVLKDLDFTIREGCIQSLLGVNGAGKSTLINLIAGLMIPDKGEVIVEGSNLLDSRVKGVRQKFGYVFERPVYIEKFNIVEYLTFVAEMYRLSKDYYRSRIDWLLDFFEFSETKKYIATFSKGAKAKVSLAASLLHEPEYIILDEPFDGMDFLMIQKVESLFRDFVAGGKTILITSHQFDLIADLSDSFALLNNGQIEFNKNKNELSELVSDDSPKSLKNYIENKLRE